MTDGGGTSSTKRRIAEKLLLPIVAAGTSAAAGYAVKRAPGFVEDTVWPRVRHAVEGGDLSEKVSAQARSVVESGGELAEQLVGHAKDVTGTGEGDGGSAGDSKFSPGELSRRSEERARNRAKRRKSTTSK